jgi:hypothetical protein
MKAEREGFEPSRRLNTAYAISNPKLPVPLRAGPYRYVAYISPSRGPLGGARTVAYRSVPARLQYGCSTRVFSETLGSAFTFERGRD